MKPTDEQYGDGVLGAARDGNLPTTGIDTIDLMIIALLLLGAGILLYLATRSR